MFFPSQMRRWQDALYVGPATLPTRSKRRSRLVRSAGIPGDMDPLEDCGGLSRLAGNALRLADDLSSSITARGGVVLRICSAVWDGNGLADPFGIAGFLIAEYPTWYRVKPCLLNRLAVAPYAVYPRYHDFVSSDVSTQNLLIR